MILYRISQSFVKKNKSLPLYRFIVSQRVKDAESTEVSEIGQDLEELVDEDVKEKVEEELDEVETYSAAVNYWPG